MTLLQKLNTKRTKRLALATLLVCVVAVVAIQVLPEQVEAQGGSAMYGSNSMAKNLGTLPSNTSGCHWYDPFSSACLQEAAAGIVNVVLWITARLVWLAGIIFNYAVDYTLNMSGLLADIPVVDIGWRIIRDIANIVFIFIALWSGISITLGLRAEKAWGLLAQMVLVALFINFSLFITKAVVDGTNIAALHFYNLMKDPAATQNADEGISGAFMKGLQLQTLYDSKTIGKEEGTDAAQVIFNTGGADVQKQVSQVNIILVGVFGSVFMVITAFVFFAAAILFIIRAITLIMLMVLSPLAFVAWILPGASGLANKWWSTLWSQSFFAPLYMALAYVVVATINSPQFGANISKLTFAAAFTSTSSPHTALIFNFLLLIGLMIGCLIVAQSLGAKGSGMVMSMGGKLKAFGMGAVGGAAGAGIRTALRFGETPAGRKILGQKWGDRMSIRNWNERFSKSTAGHTAIGKFIQQQTTGRLAEGKVFGKSAEEAHKEAREDESKIRIMNEIRDMRNNSAILEGLTDEEAIHLLREEEARRRGHAIRRERARIAAARGAPPAGGAPSGTP